MNLPVVFDSFGKVFVEANDNEIVFGKLNDIELSLPGKKVFSEELRDNPRDLFSVIAGGKEKSIVNNNY